MIDEFVEAYWAGYHAYGNGISRYDGADEFRDSLAGRSDVEVSALVDQWMDGWFQAAVDD